MWHVHNEYGCHNAHCYCDTSAEAFRDLAAASATATSTALNDAWGTAFWSQHYADWDEIAPARAHRAFANPTQLTRLPPVLLRRAARPATGPSADGPAPRHPSIPVTTNFMLHELQGARLLGLGARAGRRLQRPLPARRRPRSEIDLSLGADLTRGLARRRAVAAHGALHQRGQLAAAQPRRRPRASCAATASRTSRAAPTGSCSSSGARPRPAPRSSTPRWCRTPAPTRRSGARSCAARRRPRGASPRYAAARSSPTSPILFDWNAWWAVEGDTVPSARRHVHGPGRRPCTRRCGGRASPPTSSTPTADLSAYRLVLVPTLYLVRDDAAANLAAFVAGGRHRAGRLLQRDRRRERPHPARRLPGRVPRAARRTHRGVLPAAAAEPVTLDDRSDRDVWTELLQTTTARDASRRTPTGRCAGGPAITRNCLRRRHRLVPEHPARRRALDALLARSAPTAVSRRSRRPFPASRSRGGATMRETPACSSSTTPTARRRSPVRHRPAHRGRARRAGRGRGRRGASSSERGRARCSLSSARRSSSTRSARAAASRVSELTEVLGVSDMTVRRDLETLAARGMLEKVHGGATAIPQHSTDEPGFEAKSLPRAAGEGRHRRPRRGHGQAGHRDRASPRARPPGRWPACSATYRS